MSMVESHAPNWEAVQGEIRCPLCDYNLRGLSEPRCPECGYAFAWDEILDPTRRHHRYLFEHHPNHNLWSFFKTLSGGFRPKRFWRELHPLQKSNRWRLRLYLLLVIAATCIPIVIDGFWRVPRTSGWRSFLSRSIRDDLAWRVATRFPWNMLNWPLRAERQQLVVGVSLALIALPILNYGLLMIFQQTMRKVNVGAHHVQRCVIYSADVMFWPVVPLCVMLVYNGLSPTREWDEPIAWTLLIEFIVVWLVMTWRLVSAYRHYLRFDHPAGTILSIQLMIFLLLLLII